MSDKRVDRLRYLGLHCTKLRDENWRDEFSMRVPAEEDRDADLVLCWAADRIESLEKENAALWTEVRAFRSIVSESAGVAGYHLNDDIASWDELNIPYAAHLPPPEEQK